MLKILLCLTIVFSGNFALAQNQNQGQQGEAGSNMIEKYGPRRQISTIVYMGLAGAVLGLSTLSFYGRPQDHLTNIPIGFGVGVIVGTVYMTYQAAANPNEFYKEVQIEYRPKFIDPMPESYTASDILLKNKNVQKVSYRWTF